MKKIFIYFVVIFNLSLSFSQVGINTPLPNESAILDITSTNRGVLFPRMDLGDLNVAHPVTNPEESLMVWNTDAANGGAAKGFYYWDGTWKLLGSSSSTDNELSGVYGKLTLNSNISSTLERYNHTYINASSSGVSSGVIINESQSTMRVEVDGRYRVSYTLTYNKSNNAGADDIEFFIHKNNNSINESKKTGVLSTSKNTLTHTVELDLMANQTYGLGYSKSNEAPDSINITIYSDLTEYSIQRL